MGGSLYIFNFNIFLLNNIRNKYVKFIVKVFILLLLVAVSDQLVGHILRHFYFTQVAGADYRATYAMDSTVAKILVLGSSRANHHYVPDVFENSLNMSFYNAGRDGSYLICNYAVFKALVKRYTPKIILFDIDPDEMHYDTESYDRLSSLLPYYKDHPEIQGIVNLRSPYEQYKNISAIYPFNSYLLKIGMGNLELNKNRKGDIKGYVPLRNCLQDTVLTKESMTDGTLDSNKVNALINVMKYCNENNIKLVFIQSPFFGYIQLGKSTDLLNQLAEQHNVCFWSFANDPYFLVNPGYFADKSHLNEKGANYFCELVVKRLIGNAN